MTKRVIPIPKLTVEELAFALASGGAVYEGRMHSPPLAEVTRPIEIDGQRVRLSDIPINRAALAILESLKHDPEKAKAALSRIMLIAFDTLNHPDVKPWRRTNSDGLWEISEALIEAIATIPANQSGKVPPARVFALARKISRSKR